MEAMLTTFFSLLFSINGRSAIVKKTRPTTLTCHCDAMMIRLTVGRGFTNGEWHYTLVLATLLG